MQPTIASLHSHSDTTSYVKSQLHSKFGEHAFSFYSPAAWNSLPFLTEIWDRRRWHFRSHFQSEDGNKCSTCIDSI